MFDIGFSELLLVLVIGLVVLGPERLPVAVRTVSGWIRALRSLAASVQHELSQELKLQELQDSLKKAEQAGLQNLTPELKASMDELKEAAASLKRTYQGEKDELANTIHNPLVTDPEAIHDGVTPAEAATTATAPAAAPKPAPETQPTAALPQADTPAANAPAAVVAEAAPEPVADKTPASHQPSGDR
ncbi:Sec-independent protein translocase protein TatB [Serratia entomophila]|uniref:Sec-independent protein translocase protein TatB n=1 Tax=Serratia entomophila TaxID=42906 RepID=A0ABY5CSY6_9GAMM|nr:Sec-independent protein translocase protein TatB [Serratia entomophila]UIW18064.1 Sec-independent protein translocase protein TatB [Serratia entomophila]USV01181.1 Sec-independent protein translocase subunit TatB [Serratia entomophila]CAI0897873.1 Sec-independent protein translocase protein TatB [Serratia entomophila]CAI0940639.1 Sec-independent protein translocase protein TatB [Serratia entomophila]CAI0992455.1 Sec-independent protein translocase protein TatB [Serratia entomophila]